MTTVNDELYEKAYEAGYMQAKKENYESMNVFKETVKDHLSNLVNRAAAKGEWESLVYARQLLRSLK